MCGGETIILLLCLPVCAVWNTLSQFSALFVCWHLWHTLLLEEEEEHTRCYIVVIPFLRLGHCVELIPRCFLCLFCCYFDCTLLFLYTILFDYPIVTLLVLICLLHFGLWLTALCSSCCCCLFVIVLKTVITMLCICYCPCYHSTDLLLLLFTMWACWTVLLIYSAATFPRTVWFFWREICWLQRCYCGITMIGLGLLLFPLPTFPLIVHTVLFWILPPFVLFIDALLYARLFYSVVPIVGDIPVLTFPISICYYLSSL